MVHPGLAVQISITMLAIEKQSKVTPTVTPITGFVDAWQP